MPIGGSDGSYYENKIDFLKRVYIDGRSGTGTDTDNPEIIDPNKQGLESSTQDKNIVSPNQMRENQYQQKWDLSIDNPFAGIDIAARTSSTMPLGSPTEPASALNPQDGTETPTAVSKVNSGLDVGHMLTVQRGGPLIPMPQVLAHTKAGDITNEDVDQAINVGLSAGPGTIAGTKAATANLPNLSKALELERQGADLDHIWDQTGWFKGADNRWKHEIPDQNAHLKMNSLEMTPFSKDDQLRPGAKLENAWWQVPDSGKDWFGKPKNTLFLKDVLDHPELYKAYPDMANIKVIKTPTPQLLAGIQGYYDIGRRELALSPARMEDMKSVILHEIQHGVQDIEGFSTGANTEVFKTDRWKNLSQSFGLYKLRVRDYIDKNYKDQPGKYHDFITAIENEPKLLDIRMKADEGSELNKKILQKTEELLEEAKKYNLYEPLKKIVKGDDISRRYDYELYKKYQAVKGEVESRNVQHRRNFSEAYRQSLVPTRSEDIPREDQIWSPWDSDSLKDLYPE